MIKDQQKWIGITCWLLMLHKIVWETKMPLPIIAATAMSSFHREEWGFSANVHEFTWTEFTQIHQCLELARYKLGVKETKGSHPCRKHRNVSHKKLRMAREDQPLQKSDTESSAALNAREVVLERAQCQPPCARLQQQGLKGKETLLAVSTLCGFNSHLKYRFLSRASQIPLCSKSRTGSFSSHLSQL